MKWSSLLLGLCSLCFVECRGRTDMVFILDSSKALGANNVKEEITFTEKYLEYYSISHSTSQVGVITFASKAHLSFSFRSCGNRECILHYLKVLKLSIKPRNSSKGLIPAIGLALKLFKRQGRHYVHRKIILFTKRSNYLHSIHKKLLHIQRTLRTQGIKIQIIAFGTHYQESSNFPVQEIAGKEDLPKLLHRWFLHHKKYTKCDGEGYQRDECNRRCRCVDGILKSCTRIRQEMTTYTNEELERYVSTFIKAASSPLYKKRYEGIAIIHKTNFWAGIHDKNQFFPWHRWYLLQMENLLREIDCRVTIPFWDWSYWSPVAWMTNAHIWREEILGGDGNMFTDFCVEDGSFRRLKFETPSYENTELIYNFTIDELGHKNGTKSLLPHPYCVRRRFNGKPPSFHTVKRTINLPLERFSQFELAVRDLFHNNIHCQVGGTMCTEFASSTPEFWLHHAMLDYIWYRWQKKGTQYRDTYFTCLQSPLTACQNIAPELVDSNRLPGSVSVNYELFKVHEEYPQEKEAEDILPKDQADVSHNTNVKRRRELFALSDEEASQVDKVAFEIFSNDNMS